MVVAFKPGDKVIRNIRWLTHSFKTKDQIYIIEKIISDRFARQSRLKIKGKTGYWNSDKFILVERKPKRDISWL